MVYTPGLFLWPQPVPQLVTPARYQRLFCSQTRGPPLSPYRGERASAGWERGPRAPRCGHLTLTLTPTPPPPPLPGVPEPEPTQKRPHLAGVSASPQVPRTHHPRGEVAVIDQVVVALPEVYEVDLHLPEEGGCLLFSGVQGDREGGKGFRLWSAPWPSSCPSRTPPGSLLGGGGTVPMAGHSWAHTPSHLIQLTTNNRDRRTRTHGQPTGLLACCTLFCAQGTIQHVTPSVFRDRGP